MKRVLYCYDSRRSSSWRFWRRIRMISKRSARWKTRWKSSEISRKRISSATFAKKSDMIFLGAIVCITMQILFAWFGKCRIKIWSWRRSTLVRISVRFQGITSEDALSDRIGLQWNSIMLSWLQQLLTWLLSKLPTNWKATPAEKLMPQRFLQQRLEYLQRVLPLLPLLLLHLLHLEQLQTVVLLLDLKLLEVKWHLCQS